MEIENAGGPRGQSLVKESKMQRIEKSWMFDSKEWAGIDCVRAVKYQ